VPPSKRRSRGFGGSLLTTPQVLPDDDEETSAVELTADTRSAPVAAVRSLAEDIPSEPPAMPRQPEPPKKERELSPSSEPKQSPAKKPPGTLRLNEVAGPQLWDAFLEAKDADPFLSYRKFASDVVLDGLATRSRRQKRS
jgi:hypothetical protein